MFVLPLKVVRGSSQSHDDGKGDRNLCFICAGGRDVRNVVVGTGGGPGDPGEHRTEPEPPASTSRQHQGPEEAGFQEGRRP